MKIILIYDVSENKTEIIRKICNRYLVWIQNSVFESEITKAKLLELKNILNDKLNNKKDSVIIYEINNSKWLKKNIIGINKNEITSII